MNECYGKIFEKKETVSCIGCESWNSCKFKSYENKAGVRLSEGKAK